MKTSTRNRKHSLIGISCLLALTGALVAGAGAAQANETPNVADDMNTSALFNTGYYIVNLTGETVTLKGDPIQNPGMVCYDPMSGRKIAHGNPLLHFCVVSNEGFGSHSPPRTIKSGGKAYFEIPLNTWSYASETRDDTTMTYTTAKQEYTVTADSQVIWRKRGELPDTKYDDNSSCTATPAFPVCTTKKNEERGYQTYFYLGGVPDEK